MNPNWARWIAASIAVYFKSVSDSISLKLLCEGIDAREHEKMNYNHAELRIGGPFIKELSKDYWQLQVDINILITYLMQPNEDNVYDLQTFCGKFQQAMDGPINVYKYGGESGDDSTFVGCLRPMHGRFDSNKVLHFGQVNRVDKVRQSMIDGRFLMFLDT